MFSRGVTAVGDAGCCASCGSRSSTCAQLQGSNRVVSGCSAGQRWSCVGVEGWVETRQRWEWMGDGGGGREDGGGRLRRFAGAGEAGADSTGGGRCTDGDGGCRGQMIAGDDYPVPTAIRPRRTARSRLHYASALPIAHCPLLSHAAPRHVLHLQDHDYPSPPLARQMLPDVSRRAVISSSPPSSAISCPALPSVPFWSPSPLHCCDADG